jgi:hypothetical protein
MKLAKLPKASGPPGQRGLAAADQKDVLAGPRLRDVHGDVRLSADRSVFVQRFDDEQTVPLKAGVLDRRDACPNDSA